MAISSSKSDRLLGWRGEILLDEEDGVGEGVCEDVDPEVPSHSEIRNPERETHERRLHDAGRTPSSLSAIPPPRDDP